jgi:hypothetical protein
MGWLSAPIAGHRWMRRDGSAGSTEFDRGECQTAQ